MTETKDYKKTPYTLTEVELAKLPFSEVCDLIKHIEWATTQIVSDLKIHTENVKVLRQFSEKFITKEAKPLNLMNPISNFKPY